MNPALKPGAEQRIRELEEANAQLRLSEQMLAKELDTAQRFRQVATQLVSAQGMDLLYEQILDTALAILNGDFASIQEFCQDLSFWGIVASARKPPNAGHG
jgi:hypothetical protein